MKKYFFIFIIFIILIILIFYSANFYFLSRLSSSTSSTKPRSSSDSNAILVGSLDESNVKEIYKIRNPKLDQIRNKLIKNFAPCAKNSNYSEIWEVANNWADENEIYPQYDGYMCKVVRALQDVPLVAATNSRRGTQLKLNFLVEGNQTVYFKPAWYLRERVIEGPVYSGKDRHNSEIVAFYLGALLNLRWTPVAVGRVVNLKEIWNIADKDLQDTMFYKKNDSQLCLYGKCFYCKPSEAVCGSKNHRVEGVLLHQVPPPLAKHKSPWQRTYKDNQKAAWEQSNEDNYCDYVKTKLSQTRILDLIDAAIFDFLIQNGDRHHYETRKNRIVLIDNGKGFGNPSLDFIDILAPLYQCCMIRKSTFSRLLLFTGGSLTDILKNLTHHDLLYPLLTDNHFAALERRLLKTFSVIEFCRDHHGNSIFK